MSEKETCVALGMFDGLHLGHIEVIKAAIYEYDYTPAVFTFNDESLLPKMSKRENIITYAQKISLLKSIGVEKIYAPDFNDTKNLTPEGFVEKIIVKEINAKIVTCGYDFRFGKNGVAKPEHLKKMCGKYGIKVKIVPAVLIDNKPVSSTEIRKLIINGDIAKANRLLGYDIMYEMPVVHGSKLGRTLSFPTINQEFPSGNVLPKLGVYRSWACIDGRQYSAVTNIGLRPTVSENTFPLLETHILNYNGDTKPDLYGQVVSVSLVDFIREEKKFDSVYKLKAQIKNDINTVLGKDRI